MKYKEIANLDKKSLVSILLDKRKELVSLKCSASISKMKDSSVIKKCTKDIARYLTALRLII